MIRNHAASKLGVSIGLLCGWLVAVACSSEDEDPNPGNGGTTSGGTSSTGGSSAGGSKNTGGSSAGGSKNTGGSSAGGSKNTGGSSAGGTKNSGGSTSSGGEGGQPGGDGGSGATGSGGDAGDTSSGGEGGEDSGIGGAGGEGGGDPVAINLLANPSFELGMEGWTNQGTDGAAFVENGGHTGSKRLTHWVDWVDPDPGYTARTSQAVSQLENGTYSFSIWVDRDWFDEQYLFATGFDAQDLDKTVTIDTSDAGNGYFKFTLSGIEVTSGSCTVGVYSSAPGGTWASFDDAEFVREE